jgi:hypothetical protein
MEAGRPSRLTARRKFEIFLEAKKSPEKLGEVIRKYGLHVSDLRRIEATVEAAAVEALKVRSDGRAREAGVSRSEYEALVRELQAKDQALAELMLEHTLLKKSERSASKAAWMGSSSTGRDARR